MSNSKQECQRKYCECDQNLSRTARGCKIAIVDIHQMTTAGIAPEDHRHNRQHADRQPERQAARCQLCLIASAISARSPTGCETEPARCALAEDRDRFPAAPGVYPPYTTSSITAATTASSRMLITSSVRV